MANNIVPVLLVACIFLVAAAAAQPPADAPLTSGAGVDKVAACFNSCKKDCLENDKEDVRCEMKCDANCVAFEAAGTISSLLYNFKINEQETGSIDAVVESWKQRPALGIDSKNRPAEWEQPLRSILTLDSPPKDSDDDESDIDDGLGVFLRSCFFCRRALVPDDDVFMEVGMRSIASKD